MATLDDSSKQATGWRARPAAFAARARARAADTTPGEIAAPAIVAAVAVAFIAISVWWVLEDKRIPSGDNGKHLLIAFGYNDYIRDGNPMATLGVYNLYPPLVHLVGALGSLVAGPSVAVAVITENLVFVPLLAFGCYGAGKAAFGRWAGVLAAVFAFATPMVGSLFHVFMLDAPTAALVAVTVWGLLASEGFSRVGVAGLAGVAAGAGMYAKSTFPLFVIGIVLVMLARGGWREWRGWLTFGGVWLAIASPWYLKHADSILGQTEGAVAGEQPNWYGAVPYPDRFSLDNFTWYWWNLVNNQLYLPLTVFLLIGAGYFAWRWLGRRDPGTAIPELLVGGLFAYVSVSFITLDDPRYTLPALVYAAVIGTGWIVQARRPLGGLAVAALVAVLVLNTSMLNRGSPRVEANIKLPGSVASPISENQLKVASTTGYIESQPDPAGGQPIADLLERAHDDGARRVVFEPESLNNGGYSLNGLSVLARGAGLEVPGYTSDLVQEETDIFVFRRGVEEMETEPCLLSPAIGDGTAFYVQWGPADPDAEYRCPTG